LARDEKGRNTLTIITTVAIPPFALYGTDLGATTTNTIGTNNSVFLVSYNLRVPVTLTGVRVRFSTAGNGNYDTGIYSDVNGVPTSLLAHAAAAAGSLPTTSIGVKTPALIAGSMSLVGGNLPLPAGNYWLALWASSSLDAVNSRTGVANMTPVMMGTYATGPLPALASSITGLANGTLEPFLLGILANNWS
jgi:hypothetical protein